MSQLGDLQRLFLEWKERYKWSEDETINNFIELDGAEEWSFLDFDNKGNEIEWDHDNDPDATIYNQIIYHNAKVFLFGKDK